MPGRQGVPGLRPRRPRPLPRPLEQVSAGKKAVNRAHAKIRALGEQAMTTLKSWRLLRKLRCGTTRITDLVKAVPTLELIAST